MAAPSTTVQGREDRRLPTVETTGRVPRAARAGRLARFWERLRAAVRRRG